MPPASGHHQLSGITRPNTVAGLIAKHAELSALRDKYKSEIRTMEVNIQHLAATIRLFNSAVSVSLYAALWSGAGQSVGRLSGMC